MTVNELIDELRKHDPDKNIEIECPNGLLVEPKIKLVRETPFVFGEVKSYVLTGRY